VKLLLVDERESEAIVRPYMKSHWVNFPVALDEKGEAGRSYRTSSIPKLILIDKAGIVREIYIGTTTEAMIEEDIQAAKVGK
jgi:hypothetical protein